MYGISYRADLVPHFHLVFQEVQEAPGGQAAQWSLALLGVQAGLSQISWNTEVYAAALLSYCQHFSQFTIKEVKNNN